MSVRSQAKILGTLATIAGAMIMTLVTGPNLDLPWTRSGPTHDHHQQPQISLQHTIKGALMITIGCFSWAAFMILQAVTLRAYPAELSLTAWICLLGTAEGAAVALVMEKGNVASNGILDFLQLFTVHILFGHCLLCARSCDERKRPCFCHCI
ncbi:WAT1-related protein-like protein [Salvia divinorum]|uniref:WAT1-related protein-like protein n=1 Tax=Salvia divinorum TaxID=28513 RepID=A0ABD1GP67_SALDI